jgi:hypothetical protein
MKLMVIMGKISQVKTLGSIRREGASNQFSFEPTAEYLKPVFCHQMGFQIQNKFFIIH